MDNNDNNDDYVPSHKEDVETGIFRRKVFQLNNNNDEKIKKDLKNDNNYILYIYIFIVTILFIFIIQNIFYEDSYTNFQNLHYLKYKLKNNSKYNISHDISLQLDLNNNKNYEK